MQAPPKVECERHHPTLPVSDVLAAVDFYINKLGFSLGFTWGEPIDIAGVNLGHVSIHLVQGRPSPEGCSIYFAVGNADELYEFHRDNGVEIIEPPVNRPWEMRDYRVRDLYGYALAFGHYLPSAEPPIKIERVEVPVRLEKRIAAVLKDLAAHKGMSIDSCLEETLLHTFEKYGGGVASPHTKSTLDYIEALKKKHGIDYDVHGSYRFVE